MSDTVVVDFGAHTIKYGRVSRHSNRGQGSSVVTSRIRHPHECDDPYDVEELSRSLDSIISTSEEGCEGFACVSVLCHPLLSHRHRERIAYSLFEGMDAERVHLGFGAATVLFAAGETSGLVVDIGYTDSRVIPVVDGIPNISATQVVRDTGAAAADRVLSEALEKHHKYVESNGTSIGGGNSGNKATAAGVGTSGKRTRDDKNGDLDVFHALKANASYIDGGVDGMITSSAIPSELTLPDGTPVHTILSNTDQTRSGAALLWSTRVSRSGGIPLALRYGVRKFNCTFADTMLSTWTLCGGASRVRGVKETIEYTINNELRCHRNVDWSFASIDDAQMAAVSGGIILSKLSSFKKMTVDRATYAEEGPNCCLHVKTVDLR